MINLDISHSACCEITFNLYPPVEYNSDTFYSLGFQDRTINTARELFNILNVDIVFCHENRFILFWLRDSTKIPAKLLDEYYVKSRIIKHIISSLYNSFVKENRLFLVNYCCFRYASYENIKKDFNQKQFEIGLRQIKKHLNRDNYPEFIKLPLQTIDDIENAISHLNLDRDKFHKMYFRGLLFRKMFYPEIVGFESVAKSKVIEATDV